MPTTTIASISIDVTSCSVEPPISACAPSPPSTSTANIVSEPTAGITTSRVVSGNRPLSVGRDMSHPLRVLNGDDALRPEDEQDRDQQEHDAVGETDDPVGKPRPQQHLGDAECEPSDHSAAEAAHAT